VFEAGEVFIRKHYSTFGGSRVPLALELIEAERIADVAGPSPTQPGNMVRMGIEVDRFYRPVAYFIRQRHQGEFRLGVSRGADDIEPVPASQIYHLRIADRWPQTRGEPWLHAVIRRLQDMDGYSEAEIVAARGAASYMAAIQTPDDNSPLVTTKDDGTKEVQIEPGIVVRLAPGETFNFVSPNRPNPNMDPFMRMMLREVAAGCGVSYESLSRDYSQSNYSSSRLAILDDRDLWRVFQLWFIRSFREPLHREWLQSAVLARAIAPIGLEAYGTDIARYEAARFKPRGWSWIDPSKEVNSYAAAVRNGFMTVEDVIARTADGADIEDVLEARREELDLMSDLGLEFDTDPNRSADGKPKDAPAAAATAQPKDGGDSGSARRGRDENDEAQQQAGRIRRVV
jgi:lambda family phage portal protein